MVSFSSKHNILESVMTHVHWAHEVINARENPQRASRVFTAYVLEKLHSFEFFDGEILTSMFFPTLHDAMLHVLEKQPWDKYNGYVVRKTIYISVFLS